MIKLIIKVIAYKWVYLHRIKKAYKVYLLEANTTDTNTAKNQ